MAGESSDSIVVIHVDDDPDFAELAAKFVERQDERLNVETTTSPVEALDRIRANGVHCVVSDYDMPEQTGIEFLEAVREEFPDLPFILYTGKGSEEVATEAIHAGVTDYLQKESGTSQYEVLANRIRNAAEQHRAQEHAAETERRLRTIAENTNDILWKFTADWDELLFINSPFEEIWGRSIDDAREHPQTCLDGIHPDDWGLVEDAMCRLSAGDSVDIEFRVNAAEDFGRWVWVQGEPVFDDAGDVEKVVGFARDISDRKFREQALTEHRADLRLYKRAIESSNDLLAATDTDYNLLFANERYRAYHGLSQEEISQTALPDYLGARWEAEVKPRLDRSLAGESIRYEMDREGPDGDDRLLDIRYYPLRDDEDTIIGAVAAMRDITDRVGREGPSKGQNDQRHRTRARNEPDGEFQLDGQPDEYEQFVDFFENAAVPMHWVGPNGTVLHANQAELDALGYSRDEYVGHHIADFHADQAVIDDILDRLSSDEELQDYEARMVRQDGSIRHVLIDSCVNWEEGEFVNTRCVTRDVTERRERQRELQRTNDRLEKFASIVSHDLRNPLSVVEGRLKLAQVDGDLEHIGPAVTAIQRSQALIDDLLSLAREGEAVDDSTPTRLAEVVENCWEFVETTATLSIETDQVIQADPSRLRQLTENLVRNAVDHGGDDVTISVGDLETQDGFYVADDGLGIAEDEREQVFDSGHSTSEEGTGLGLAIVEEIVEAHGWEILVTDSRHGGARFDITGVDTVAE